MAALAAAHLFAAAGLLATDLPAAGKLAALPILAWSLVANFRRLPSGALTLGSDGKLVLAQDKSDPVECTIDASTAVLPWLIVMRLRTPAGRKSLTLPVDALGADGHRRLRVWLKWKATAETA